MTKKTIVLIVLWLIYVFTDYFFLPYFVQPLAWLIVCLTLIFLIIKNIAPAITRRNELKFNKIVTLSSTIILFFLTFYNFNKVPSLILEKVDWAISFNMREQIVNQVKFDQLKSNTTMNNGICRLPYRFPIVSNGGNDILIFENKNDKTKTIKFWISRGFFESPQTYFIYTNDSESKKHYEELINMKPEFNWRLEENWYRIMESD